jgi:hypothetical protein
MAPPRLIFVYAVDGGLTTTLRDYVHKLIAPRSYPCRLCGLTYGPLGESRAWSGFRETLPVSTEFLHRDEFRRAYPLAQYPLPAVLIARATGGPELFISADEIDRCANTPALVSLVRERVQSMGAR